jgi:hypothetical protein
MVIHSPVSATRSPQGIRIRPAARCHPRCRRRTPGENWNAPRMLYTIAAGMWSSTGNGAAKNRAFSGVISAPPASWATRAVPAIAGTMLSTTRAAGMSQSDFFEFMMLSL